MQSVLRQKMRCPLAPPETAGCCGNRQRSRRLHEGRLLLFILTVLAALAVWLGTGAERALANARTAPTGANARTAPTGANARTAPTGANARTAPTGANAGKTPAAPGNSGPDTAFLYWDSSRRELNVLRQGEKHRSSIPEGTALEFEDFRRRLARSAAEKVLAPEEEAAIDSMAAELGEILFGSFVPWLQPARRWVIGPLSAAPVGALRAPWQDGAQRLVDTVVLSYVPEDPTATRAANTFQDGSEAPGNGSAVPSIPARKKQGTARDLLAVLPYTPGFTPVQDDPDTLLWVLRPLLRTLDTLPRSQTSSENLRAICAGHPYRIVLLRSRPTEADTLLAALDASTRLVWWVRPPRENSSLRVYDRAQALEKCLQQLETLCRTERRAVADLWPRPDTPLADGGRIWIESLRDSSSVAEALAHARRALKRRYPHLPGLWAGWIAAGEVDTGIDLQPPGFLQRLFPRRK